MEGTISIENLWMFIKSMSLSADNQRWLADRLIENLFLQRYGIFLVMAKIYCLFGFIVLILRYY